MQRDFDKLLAHYATVTDGSSVLFVESFKDLCHKHGVTPDVLSHAFAREVAERLVSDRIDFETGDFAINDLFWASDCSLTGFALDVFHAFEDGEVMSPHYPPGTIPWKDYTLPALREALARDEESRGPN
ncbi:hypothetical protein [Arenimonas aestuarii]